MPILDGAYTKWLLFLYVTRKNIGSACSLNVFGCIAAVNAESLGSWKTSVEGAPTPFLGKMLSNLWWTRCLQLLGDSCPLWCALWLLSSTSEAHDRITRKENGLISICLGVSCGLWMDCRLQTPYSTIVPTPSFFFRISHWTFSVTSSVKPGLKKNQYSEEFGVTQGNAICLSKRERTKQHVFSSISHVFLINKTQYLLVSEHNDQFPMFWNILRVSFTHFLTCLFQ